MEDLSKLYSASFFARRHRLNWRVPIICNAIESTFDYCFRNKYDVDLRRYNVVDVGCAIGDYVHEFNKRGFKAIGIEGSKAAAEYFVTESILIHDMRHPHILNFTADLCMCLEVVEHIEAQYADCLIGNLTRLAGVILLSAAKPGQKGHGHVNCQPSRYWEDLFWKSGFLRHKENEQTFRKRLEPWQRKKGISGYYGNIMVFKNYLS